MIILVINSEDLLTHKLALVREKLVMKVEDFRASILEMEDDDHAKLSKELYQLLIHPIERLIQDKKNLLLITEDILETFPFDALITTRNKFLLEEKLLLNNLSVGLAYQAKLSQMDRLESFVGFAPHFKNIPDIPDLPSSVEEVKEIATLFKHKGLVGDSLISTFANKTRFLEIKDKYACVHLSTHSVFFEKNPSQNRIYFHPNKQNGKNHLHLNEIYALSLKANLLVLSSCESALGELRQGEGVLSLGRAFSYIGIPNIVYSLWQIEDNLSKRFMVYFYQAILEGNTYALAFNIAKIKLIRQDGYTSPFWWAGFHMMSSH